MIKKILLTFIVAIIAVFAYIKVFHQDLYEGYTYDVSPQADFLNKVLAEEYGDKYKIYTAGFNPNESIPDISENNSGAILWLGRQNIKITPDIPQKIGKFDFILTTDFNKLYLGEFFNKKIYQFPEFALNTRLRISGTPQYYALIGNPLYAKEVLKARKLPYKQYLYKDIEKLRKDLPQIKGIIIEENKKREDYNIDLVFLEALINDIIISKNKINPTTSSEALLGEIVEYYFDKKELSDIIRKNEDEEYLNNKEFNKEWIKKFFTADVAKQRLLSVLNNKSYRELDNKWINIYVKNKVGFHPAGDTWLAKDMLRKIDKNYNYYLTFEDTTYRPSSFVQITLVGRINDVAEENTSDNGILWLAYPHMMKEQPKKFSQYMEEFAELSKYYKTIAVASTKMQNYLSEKGIETELIFQFTNTERFYPDYDETKKSDILFVGNNHFERKMVNIAKKHNMPITIYGNWWPKGWASAKYVDNRILRKYYSSAKIVLSDQNAYMKDFGVIVNRIFDATACNTLVISEYVDAIEETYGDCVPMWKTEEEFVSLVNYYLEHEAERKEKAQCAYEITLKNFTSEKAAAKFNKIIEEIYSQNK